MTTTENVIYEDNGPMEVKAMHCEQRYGTNDEYRIPSILIVQHFDGGRDQRVSLSLENLEAIVKAARAAERAAKK